MSITPVFIRITTPDNPPSGYPDIARLYDSNYKMIYDCYCSTNPNGYRPSDRLGWTDAYAQICLGRYSYDVITHDKYGKCLMINDGNAVPTTNFNINQNGNYATEIFLHSGGIKSSDPKWRGSRGCLTIHPDEFAAYMAHFDDMESGQIILTDDIGFELTKENLF